MIGHNIEEATYPVHEIDHRQAFYLIRELERRPSRWRRFLARAREIMARLGGGE